MRVCSAAIAFLISKGTWRLSEERISRRIIACMRGSNRDSSWSWILARAKTSSPVAEASDTLTLSSWAIRASAVFTPGFTHSVILAERLRSSVLFGERGLPVSEGERRSPSVPGAGCAVPLGALPRAPLSCHLREAERFPSTDTLRETLVVSEKESRTSKRPSGLTAEGSDEAARRAGVREETRPGLAIGEAPGSED